MWPILWQVSSCVSCGVLQLLLQLPLLLLPAWFALAAHPVAPTLQAFADHDTGPQEVSGKPGSAGQ
jgi:hypothetical protein